MESIVSKINKEIKKIFVEAGYEESYAYISISNRPELADYQINSCFNIAKSIKKNPIEVANTVTGLIKDVTIEGKKAFEKCEACPLSLIHI